MPGGRDNSANRGNNFKKNWRGGGNNKFAKHYQQARKNMETHALNGGERKFNSYSTVVPTALAGNQDKAYVILAKLKSLNPLNQYYLDNFMKLKKDADFKNLRN